MGVLVSMGGFIFGYDTGECDLDFPLNSKLIPGKVKSPASWVCQIFNDALVKDTVMAPTISAMCDLA